MLAQNQRGALHLSRSALPGRQAAAMPLFAFSLGLLKLANSDQRARAYCKLRCAGGLIDRFGALPEPFEPLRTRVCEARAASGAVGDVYSELT